MIFKVLSNLNHAMIILVICLDRQAAAPAKLCWLFKALKFQMEEVQKGCWKEHLFDPRGKGLAFIRVNGKASVVTWGQPMAEP